jgi:ATP-independent RNA helicase DbpA
LSARIQRDPVRVSVSSTVASDRLRQLVFHLEPDGNRHAQIAALLAEHAQQDDASALLFCETRVDCDRLARFLSQRGAAALALHGRLEQRERDDVLVQFANGSCRLLVATDVAARGLDIPALPLVIVTEVSPIPENHVHRIGRTGRAGEPGLALTVVRGPVEAQRLAAVEALLGAPIPVGPPVTAEPRLAFLASTNQTVVLLRGRKHKLRKGDVLGALVKDAKLPADAIGRIDLADTTCAIAIRRDVVVQALRFFQRSRVKNKRMPVVLLGE